MAVTAEAVTVAVTATAHNDGTPGRIHVAVPTGGTAVSLGGSDVDTGDGFPLAAGESIVVNVDAGEILYAVVATDTQAVNVLRS